MAVVSIAAALALSLWLPMVGGLLRGVCWWAGGQGRGRFSFPVLTWECRAAFNSTRHFAQWWKLLHTPISWQDVHLADIN